MKAKLLTALLFSIFATSGEAARTRSVEQQLREDLAGKEAPGSLFYQARLDRVDYRKLLRGAIAKDDDALARLFRYTSTGNLMGEGAEEHCGILRKLLLFRGDREFARVLAKEPPKVRDVVVSWIGYAWPHPGWRPNEFPRTYRLGKHE